MTTASDTVGKPAQRAISKLCSSVMQVTLKIKSAGTISGISPILAMLQGCDADWPIIRLDVSVTMCDEPTTMVADPDICIYSLGHISMQTSANVRGLMITNLINIYQIEAVDEFSASEFHHILILCMVNMWLTMSAPKKGFPAKALSYFLSKWPMCHNHVVMARLRVPSFPK